MRKTFALLAMIAFSSPTIAQIINAERLRFAEHDKPFYLLANLNFALNKNKAGQTASLGGQIRMEYAKSKDRLLFAGGNNLTQFISESDPEKSPKTFVENYFAHLRYNRVTDSAITPELFIQWQNNQIQEVQIRLLAGAGARFKLADDKKVALFWGISHMLEYEKEAQFSESVINRDNRLSSYLSIAYQVTSDLTLNHISYYQPLIDQFSDFRIASETSLTAKISARLSFQFFYQLNYDAAPPKGVTTTQYAIRNGFSYNF